MVVRFQRSKTEKNKANDLSGYDKIPQIQQVAGFYSSEDHTIDNSKGLNRSMSIKRNKMFLNFPMPATAL